MSHSVLIIDFGSQVTQLIARRVRELGVYCQILPFTRAIKGLEELKPQAIILSGAPASVNLTGAPRIPDEILAAGLPILGICYGQQAMVTQLGGRVSSALEREFGRAMVEPINDSPLFSGVWSPGESHQVWMNHGDKIVNLPEGFTPIGRSEGSPLAVIADETRKLYGLQFHPEVSHTPDGKRLLANFIFNIAGIEPNWSMSSFRQEERARIRAVVGASKVICGLSGGVDSAVVALLIHQAIGEQLTCILVDHGMLRQGEAEQIVELFKRHYQIKLIHVEAQELFLNALGGVSDPETKRKIIGNLFIEVFEQEANKIGEVEFLAQGTLYPDVIESASISGGTVTTIKSHHNVGGLPQRMNLKLLEPLRELFKDEVRELGREMGMAEDFITRHPFPGPGLAIRIPGVIKPHKLEILRKVDDIYLEEIRKNGLYHEIWQAFGVLLPVKTVGIMGDDRSYEYVCALRAVTSTDGMTAEFYPFDMKFLADLATRIVNEVRGVNRVVYDITSKPPGTIEWE